MSHFDVPRWVQSVLHPLLASSSIVNLEGSHRGYTEPGVVISLRTLYRTTDSLLLESMRARGISVGIVAAIGVTVLVALSFAGGGLLPHPSSGLPSVASSASDLQASGLSPKSSGNDTIGQSSTLTSDLFAANLTIDPGVVLTTNGFSIIVAGTFDNQGTIVTGASADQSYPDSLGGSGGGAQSLNYCADDEDGLSTLAAGGAFTCLNTQNGSSGGSPPAPSLTSAEIASWYANGIQNYLAGAAGGGIAGYVSPGSGADGLYIQAQTLVAGAINATGEAGQGRCSGIGLSGAGGGGAILLAYGQDLESTVDVSAWGGVGSISCSGQVASGGGGAGQLLGFPYGSVPPVTANSAPNGNVVISVSQTLTSDLLASNLTIEPTAVLTTNGFSIVVSGILDNEGSIVTGPSPAGSFAESIGGSGGGAQSLNYCADDENGGSTLAPGGSLSCSNSVNGASGASPAAPSLSDSTLASWYSAGMQDYLAGGTGGAVQGYIPGGAGANGLYIQAQLMFPGTIDAAGANGQGTCSGVGLSGGGGGGAVILAYGLGVFGALNLNSVGGTAAPSCSGTVASGAGGSGQLDLVGYGTSPPVTVSSNSSSSHSAGPPSSAPGSPDYFPTNMFPPLSATTAFELVALTIAVAGIALGVYGARRPPITGHE
jgi:hypothetical protein